MHRNSELRVPLITVIAVIFCLGGCDTMDTEAPSPLESSADIAAQEQKAVRVQSLAPAGELLISFDEETGQLPEGIAVDKTGNIFVSIAPLGQLWKFRPGSTTPELFGSVPGVDGSAGDTGILGLAVDAPGNVYAGVQSLNPDANGVWRFDGKTGEASRVPGSESLAFANDVAFDKRGNLYITDSILGAIWRLPKHGELEPWLIGDDNLAGTGALGLGVPIGANGIEYRHGTLYVANTEKSLLVTVPVNNDGSPGTSSVLAALPAFEVAPEVFAPGVPDGLAIDVHGNIFIAQIAASAIARVDPHGEISEVLVGDPLDWPSSLAFGTGKGLKQTLLIVNFSIGEANGDPTPRMGPGLVAVDAGVPGMPLP